MFRRWGFAIWWIAGCVGGANAAVTFDEVKNGFRPSDTLVLDRNGEMLQRVRTDATVRRGQWIALEDVSPSLRTALVWSEDKRFYEHSGVDWRAVSAAAWGNVWNSRTRGASTITMQLASLLDGDWRAGPGGRGMVQKLGQTVMAQVLERNWRKDQILEAYLNLVPLRGELVGIDAVSQTLFGKAANGLDGREAAIAAALVRAPNARPGVVARRACELLAQMQPDADLALGSAVRSTAKAGKPCDGLDMLASAALQRKAWHSTPVRASHRTWRARP